MQLLENMEIALEAKLKRILHKITISNMRNQIIAEWKEIFLIRWVTIAGVLNQCVDLVR